MTGEKGNARSNLGKVIGRLGGLFCIGCCLFLVGRLLPASGASLQNAPDVSWATPLGAALNNLGLVSTGEDQRSYDCTNLTYRLLDDLSKTMQQGCFMRAAFGLIDPDQSVAIFNGSDEAEPIRLGGSAPAISIVPDSVSVARFGGFPVEGTYMYLYSYFPNHLDNGRDLHLRRYKELTGVPEFTVKDSAGQALPVNPQAFAYSGRGKWFVTESPSHSLVRVNLATFGLLPFDTSYAVAGKPYADHVASMAITDDGRYAAAASNEFSSFWVYDLAHCVATDAPDALAPQACQKHDYWSYVQRQVTGELRSISHVSFVGDDLLRFDAVTSVGTESYLMSPQGPISSLIPYLGLGDSFASGQGAFNYDAGTDTAVNHCHLSARSYPLLLTNDLFSGQGHSVACSGAVMHDITDLSEGYTGQAADQKTAAQREADGSDAVIIHNYAPGYLAQERFVTSYQPGIITAEIGGNDVGFKDILLGCLSPLRSAHSLNANDCYAGYEDRLEIEQTIDRQYPKWRQLYKDLQQTSPLSRIYAIGYPQIVSGSGRCGLNMPVTTGDINLARDLTTYLNSVLRKAALASGVTYVDVSEALAGHELCDNSPQPAVNGITAGNDVYGVLGQESFHPTAYGQELLEQAILTATKHFTTPAAPIVSNPNDEAPQPNSEDALLQTPASGRAIKATNYDSALAPTSAKAGQSLVVSHNGTGDLLPNTPFLITLNGTQIGSGQTNGQGGATATVTVPTETSGGTQPISVNGQNTNGDPITITTTIYVYVSDGDYDGDGIANGQDSCPLVKNSGVDTDQDGIDDSCDQYIGSTGSTTPTDSGSQPAGSTSVTAPVTSPTTPSPQPAQSTAVQNDFTGFIQASGSMLLVDKNPLQATAMGTSSIRSLGVARAANASAKSGQALAVSHVRQPTLTPLSGASRLPKLPLRRVAWWLFLGLCLGLAAVYYGCRVLLGRGRDYSFAPVSL